jgi:hypothetical protein
MMPSHQLTSMPLLQMNIIVTKTGIVEAGNDQGLVASTHSFIV